MKIRQKIKNWFIFKKIDESSIATELMGMQGKMIYGSKTAYRDMYPQNLIAFNANICTSKRKIWWGDIDLTKSKINLIQLAILLKKPIYVLFEHDARFENETKFDISKAVVTFYPNGNIQLNKRYAKYYSNNLIENEI